MNRLTRKHCASVQPQLTDIALISGGWVNKYLLTYTMPDGSLYTYESVSRKGLEAYRNELLQNARRSATRDEMPTGNATSDDATLDDATAASTTPDDATGRTTPDDATGRTTPEAMIPEAPKPDAVCIVPQLPDGKVLLIREFRYPLNSWCVAFPAGLMEAGEDLATAVDRELREETGYRLATEDDSLEPLPQTGYSSTGMSEENVQVVFAKVEAAGEAQPEDAEFIETFLLAPEEIRPFLDANTLPIGTRCQLILEMLARTHL